MPQRPLSRITSRPVADAGAETTGPPRRLTESAACPLPRQRERRPPNPRDMSSSPRIASLSAGIAFALIAGGCQGETRAGGKRPDPVVHRIAGLAAGGLDEGSLLSGRVTVKRGKPFMIALVTARNHSPSSATITRVTAITRPRNLRTSPVRIYLAPRDGKTFLPLTSAEWPPPEAPFIKRLPEPPVVVPSQRDVQFPLAARSTAPVGTTVSLVSLRSEFLTTASATSGQHRAHCRCGFGRSVTG